MLDISLAWYLFNLGNLEEFGTISSTFDSCRSLRSVWLCLVDWSPAAEARVQIFSVLLILAALMILAALVIYALNLPRHSGRCRTRCSGRGRKKAVTKAIDRGSYIR